jgi:two-component system chemotaxis response regulator CheB
MFETEAGGVLHYVCHVGHSWSPHTLLDAQEHSVEAALYNAASKLREVAAVHRRVAQRDGRSGEDHRDRHLQAADRAERNSRRIIEEMIGGAADEVRPPGATVGEKTAADS